MRNQGVGLGFVKEKKPIVLTLRAGKGSPHNVLVPEMVGTISFYDSAQENCVLTRRVVLVEAANKAASASESHFWD